MEDNIIVKVYCKVEEGLENRLVSTLEEIGSDRKYRLCNTIDDNGVLQPIHSIKDWLKNRKDGYAIPVMTNGLENELITLHGICLNNFFELPSGQIWYFAIVRKNPEDAGRWTSLVFQSFIDQFDTVLHATANLGSTEIISVTDTHPQHEGLPELLPIYKQSYLIPPQISWVNFWSNITMQQMDWKPEDTAFFSDVEEKDHGIKLLLSEEPLQLSNHEHKKKLICAYQRFTTIWKPQNE